MREENKALIITHLKTNHLENPLLQRLQLSSEGKRTLPSTESLPKRSEKPLYGSISLRAAGLRSIR